MVENLPSVCSPLKYFLWYIGILSSWSTDHDHLSKLSTPTSTKRSPHIKFHENSATVSENLFKDVDRQIDRQPMTSDQWSASPVSGSGEIKKKGTSLTTTIIIILTPEVLSKFVADDILKLNSLCFSEKNKV